MSNFIFYVPYVFEELALPLPVGYGAITESTTFACGVNMHLARDLPCNVIAYLVSLMESLSIYALSTQPTGCSISGLQLIGLL